MIGSIYRILDFCPSAAGGDNLALILGIVGAVAFLGGEMFKSFH